MFAVSGYCRACLRQTILIAPFALATACVSRNQPTVALSAPLFVDPELLFDRSFEVFDRAVFYKPREPQDVKFDLTLAPLIVQEIPHTSESVADISPYPVSGGHREPAAAPSVFVRQSIAQPGLRQAHGDLDEDRYRVTDFTWRYPGSQKPGTHVIPEVRGVRVISTTEGIPLIWQVLDSRGGQRMGEGQVVLFVSKVLEDAAAEQFGPPLPGRRYSIEKSLEEAPRVVVARVVADGPVPMGPYVYVAGEDHTITAILCRCMPSQVNEFVETRYYELNESLPVHSEKRQLFRRSRPISPELNPEWCLMTDKVAIHSELRWPRLPSDRPTTSTAGASSP